jgi:hypothetical protein
MWVPHQERNELETTRERWELWGGGCRKICATLMETPRLLSPQNSARNTHQKGAALESPLGNAFPRRLVLLAEKSSGMGPPGRLLPIRQYWREEQPARDGDGGGGRGPVSWAPSSRSRGRCMVWAYRREEKAFGGETMGQVLASVLEKPAQNQRHAVCCRNRPTSRAAISYFLK